MPVHGSFIGRPIPLTEHERALTSLVDDSHRAIRRAAFDSMRSILGESIELVSLSWSSPGENSRVWKPFRLGFRLLSLPPS